MSLDGRGSPAWLAYQSSYIDISPLTTMIEDRDTEYNPEHCFFLVGVGDWIPIRANYKIQQQC